MSRLRMALLWPPHRIAAPRYRIAAQWDAAGGRRKCNADAGKRRPMPLEAVVARGLVQSYTSMYMLWLTVTALLRSGGEDRFNI